MLQGPILIEPKVHLDERGFFLEAFQRQRYKSLGVDVDFCQDNHSFSKKNVVRGMHFQKGQGKLIYCPVGEIFDVAVDIREGSATFGKWHGVYLSEKNHHQFYIPDGFAHGFCVLSEVAHVFYKITSYFDPNLESGFSPHDPVVGIEWPSSEFILSKRDLTAKNLNEVTL